MEQFVLCPWVAGHNPESQEIHEQLGQWNPAEIQSVQIKRLGEVNLPILILRWNLNHSRDSLKTFRIACNSI